jgi:hypothetical protein
MVSSFTAELLDPVMPNGHLSQGEEPRPGTFVESLALVCVI